MTFALTLARIAGWIIVGFALGAMLPIVFALFVLGHAATRAAFGYRDALVWVLERLDRIAMDAGGGAP